MSGPVARELTYDDLARFPQDDRLRRELIDGELFESPPPVLRHQRSVVAIMVALHRHAEVHGGLALPAPMDVVFSPDTVVEPDVVFLGPDTAARLDNPRFIDVLPDLLVEVSSPTTRRLDLVKKRNLYEREGVEEYWFVDLDADRVDVYRLDGKGRYGLPATLGPGEALTCLAAPGLALTVAEALAR